jgi:hypothetical protein
MQGFFYTMRDIEEIIRLNMVDKPNYWNQLRNEYIRTFKKSIGGCSCNYVTALKSLRKQRGYV